MMDWTAVAFDGAFQFEITAGTEYGNTVVTHGAADNNTILFSDRRLAELQFGRRCANAGGVDKQAVDTTARYNLGVAGHDGDTAGVGGPAHGSEQVLQFFYG